jgi:hypothetical protein
VGAFKKIFFPPRHRASRTWARVVPPLPFVLRCSRSAPRVRRARHILCIERASCLTPRAAPPCLRSRAWCALPSRFLSLSASRTAPRAACSRNSYGGAAQTAAQPAASSSGRRGPAVWIALPPSRFLCRWLVELLETLVIPLSSS